MIFRNTSWFLNINASSVIELPYGYYISYKKERFEKLNKVQRVLKVHFLDKIDLNNDINNSINIKKYNLEIQYLDISNKKVKANRLVIYHKDTKLWGDSLNDLYYNTDGGAEITLHHHNYDKEKEEEQKRMDEEMGEDMRRYMEWEANLSDEERYFNPAFGD